MSFDIQSYINMMLQMAQMQQQDRQANRAMQDPLGTVGRSNARPSGRTDDAVWGSIFGGRDQRLASEQRAFGSDHPGYLGKNMDQAQYRPPAMSFEDAAVRASQELPYAAALRAMPAQSPFIQAKGQLNPMFQHGRAMPTTDMGTYTQNILHPPEAQYASLGESDAWAGGRYRGPRKSVPNRGVSAYRPPQMSFGM